MTRRSKWKIERETLIHKLTKERTYRKFNKVEKACILLTIVVVGFFAATYGYYANVYLPTTGCQAPYILVGDQCKADPFSVIWDGQSTPVYVPKYSATQQFLGCDPLDAFCSLNIAVTKGDLIAVSDYCYTTPPNSDVSFADNQGNSYTKQTDHLTGGQSGTCLQLQTAFASSTGTLTITQGAYNTWTSFVVSTFSNVLSVGSIVIQKAGTSVQSPDVITTSTFNSIVLESAIGVYTGASGTVTYNSGQTDIYHTCQNPGSGVYACILNSRTPATVTTHSITFSNLGQLFGSVHIGLLLLGSSHTCPDGYLCSNAVGNINGDTVMQANATFPGVTLSTSSINLAIGVSKSLAFAMVGLPTSNNMVIGQKMAWFVTANGTLPTQAGYNPINDPNVVLLMYAVLESGNFVNYYVYMQRQAGQASLLNNNDDSYPTCPYSSTLFRCAHIPFNTAGTGSNGFNLVLNFTGGSTGAGGSGQSYLCGGSVASGTNTCNVGGIGRIADQNGGAISYPGYLFNQTLFPWINIQNNYHFGFWQAANAPEFLFTTSANSNGAIISYYIPPTSSTSPNTDSGGFIGWLKQSFVSSSCSSLKALTFFLADPCTQLANAPQDFASSVANGFGLAITILLKSYQIILNFIGGLWGMGNLGDIVVSVLVAIGNLIVSGFSAIVGFFIGLGVLISSGYFSFLAGAAALIGSLLPIVLIILGFVFNGIYTVTDLIFFDLILGMIMISQAMKKGHGCLRAFFGWMNLNYVLFTFVFNMAWVIFDIVTRPIHRVKETVDPVG